MGWLCAHKLCQLFRKTADTSYGKCSRQEVVVKATETHLEPALSTNCFIAALVSPTPDP